MTIAKIRNAVIPLDKYIFVNVLSIDAVKLNEEVLFNNFSSPYTGNKNIETFIVLRGNRVIGSIQLKTERHCVVYFGKKSIEININVVAKREMQKALGHILEKLHDDEYVYIWTYSNLLAIDENGIFKKYVGSSEEHSGITSLGFTEEKSINYRGNVNDSYFLHKNRKS